MKYMQRFMDWYQGNNDTETEPPRAGLARVWYILRNDTGRLFAVNLLFLACCLPVVTIPAALSALNRYLSRIFRVGYGFSLKDYGKEFRESLWKNIPLGLVVFLLGFYGYYLMSLAGNFRGSNTEGMLFGMGAGILLTAVLLGTWIFLLTALFSLPCRHLLKNAVILMMAEWKRSLLILLETVLFWGIVLAAAPYSVWLILLGFSVQQLTVYAIAEPAVERRLIAPYERMRADRS